VPGPDFDDINDSEPRFDVVVLTALAVEGEAVVQALRNCSMRKWQGQSLRVGDVAGQRVLVFPIRGMGNAGAAQAAQRVIGTWNLARIMLVGICGGVPSASSDLRLGDVLVPDQVVGYELGKLTPGRTDPHHQAYPSDHELRSCAQSIQPGDWVHTIATPRPDQSMRYPLVHVGPMLSGEKVVADPAVLEELRQHWPQALGVEMESHGVALTAHRNRRELLVVKAISDFADTAKNDNWHRYAAEAAARFTVAVLASATPAADHRQPQAQPSTAHIPSYFPPTDFPSTVSAPAQSTPVTEWSPSWRTRAAVDHDQDGLFGIEAATSRLVAALANPTGAWIVSVRGTGGVGKTTLAYEAAGRAQQSGAVEQVLWTTVRGDVPGFEGDAAPEASWMETVVDLADQVGVSLGPNRRVWCEGLQDALGQAGGRILTVVDNVETANQAAALVSELHRCGFVRPHKLLVTSRSLVGGPIGLVQQHAVRGLSEDDAIALMRYVGKDDEHLAAAPAATFIPIVRITEGNPYLLKLVVGHFLSSAMPLEQVVDELTDLEATTFRGGDNLARQVKDYLFDRSLAELELVAGSRQAQLLMAAFCVKRRGDEIAKDELWEISGLPMVEFDATLRYGCDLGLVQASRLNRRYSIHSLLYEYTRPTPAEM
jgi:nucleoside phosphorylase